MGSPAMSVPLGSDARLYTRSPCNRASPSLRLVHVQVLHYVQPDGGREAALFRAQRDRICCLTRKTESLSERHIRKQSIDAALEIVRSSCASFHRSAIGRQSHALRRPAFVLPWTTLRKSSKILPNLWNVSILVGARPLLHGVSLYRSSFWLLQNQVHSLGSCSGASCFESNLDGFICFGLYHPLNNTLSLVHYICTEDPRREQFR